MKYTRDNINNDIVFGLRVKARQAERANRQLIRDIDTWLETRDEKALEVVLAKLNEGG